MVKTILFCFQPFTDFAKLARETSLRGVHGDAHDNMYASGRGSLVLFPCVRLLAQALQIVIIVTYRHSLAIASLNIREMSKHL